MEKDENMHVEETKEEIVVKEETTETKETESTEQVEKKETTEKVEEEKVRTYTQEEYENGIKKAIANRFKEKEKESKESLEKGTEGEKNKEEYNRIASENKSLKMQLKMAEIGVDKNFMDFIMFKHKDSKDFEKDLTKFIEENPQYIKKEQKKDTGKIGAKIDDTQTNGVDSILKAKYPGVFK